jgi:hypothetical protein
MNFNNINNPKNQKMKKVSLVVVFVIFSLFFSGLVAQGTSVRDKYGVFRVHSNGGMLRVLKEYQPMVLSGFWKKFSDTTKIIVYKLEGQSIIVYKSGERFVEYSLKSKGDNYVFLKSDSSSMGIIFPRGKDNSYEIIYSVQGQKFIFYLDEGLGMYLAEDKSGAIFIDNMPCRLMAKTEVDIFTLDFLSLIMNMERLFYSW